MKREGWEGCWKGQTVACLASGPSLTVEDCEAVRAAGWRTIVTNTTFRMAPWADVLFGHDGTWWKFHRKEIDATFAGRRITFAPSGPSYGAESLHRSRWLLEAGNSGAQAIVLAVAAGAVRVVLLGMDCQKTGGKTHWHGDHEKGLGNARTMPNWPKHFARAAKFAGKTPVLNCSRATALTCFPRVELESLLEVETC